jgi:hypothetical protein
VLRDILDPVNERSWLPSSVWRQLCSQEQNNQARKRPELLDEIPSMLSTVLGLNILLQEPSIDLKKVSELVLNDLGATIQILRLIAREPDLTPELPCRMGGCLASLDVDQWFRAISARTFPRDLEHVETSGFWEHSRLVGQYAQLVAESMGDISPEDAYLVGLLHGVSSIPKVLGWTSYGSGGEVSEAMRAMEGTLPPFVLDAIHSMTDSAKSAPWRFILTAAHELASARMDYVCDNAPSLECDGHGIISEETSVC